MITSATISHYKSVQNAQLRLRPINVLVGPNGSGKSNILDAIYFLHDCALDDIDTAVTKRHGIDSIRQWSRTRPYNITIELDLKNMSGHGAYKVVISSSKGRYRIIEESGMWCGSHPRDYTGKKYESKKFTSKFKRDDEGNIVFFSDIKDLSLERNNRIDSEELFLSSISGRMPILSLLPFRPIAEEITSFAKYNIYPNTLREPQLVSRENSLSESGSNLSSILKKINSNKRYSELKEDIITSLKMLMPHVIDFQIRSAAGYYVPVLRVKEDGGDVHDFNLSQISDGTLRTLGLLAAFYQPNAPSKIGIEEPEQMIHPGALPILSEAMTAFVAPRPRRERQVFVTTHSPTLIDLVEPEDIIWARFVGGVTECGHVKGRQMNIIKRQLFTAGEILLAEGFFE